MFVLELKEELTIRVANSLILCDICISNSNSLRNILVDTLVNYRIRLSYNSCNAHVNCLLFCVCRSRLIDGTDVLQEVYCKPRQGGVHEDLPRRGPDHPPVGHHECINDIAVTKLPHNYVISAGRDGVIKIWK